MWWNNRPKIALKVTISDNVGKKYLCGKYWKGCNSYVVKCKQSCHLGEHPLNKHKQIVDGNEVFKCKFCGERFENTTFIRNHSTDALKCQ